jgi:23S rRNA (cytidine1920-2'-O)/16S rRNA (cytidine1409-2'-O)-methyltransferase
MSNEARDPVDARASGSRGRTRERLDLLMVSRGIAPSRERARALIMAGEVYVAGQRVVKAGTLIPTDAAVELAVAPSEMRFVSRGGLKLERALNTFQLDPAGCTCLDVGASTGGFTDLLLQRGAAHVYAVDVGHGQLAWSLRNDPRVTVLERTNIRHLEALPELADCAVIDVSFISLRLVLPRVATLLRPDGWVVALVKPQFEAGRAEADRGAGIIREPAVHRRVLTDLLTWLSDAAPVASGYRLIAQGLIASPITGRDGNHEYLVLLRIGATRDSTALDALAIEHAIQDAFPRISGK